jgi:hypothetical protein
MATTSDTTDKPLIAYCRSAIDALRAQYDMTKVVHHRVSMDAVREAILRDFLAAHLPEVVTAMTGVVFDATGRYSRQQDIVLALKSFPRLPFASGVDLIYVEGVVACVEVKTKVAPSHWTGGNNMGKTKTPSGEKRKKETKSLIGENIASVRVLSPSSLAGVVVGNLDWDDKRIFNAVVTYDGSGLADIRSAITNRPDNEWPDVYLDVSRGMLVLNTGFLMPLAEDVSFIEIADPAVALARFITFLTRVTGRTVLRDVNWDAYLA